MVQPPSATDAAARGREAYEQLSWRDAYEHLSAADQQESLDAQDLDRLARAAYLIGHLDTASETWERTHHAFLGRGETAPAVRCAFWLGLTLVMRGEHARGGGWLGRAQHILEDTALDCVERGYLRVPLALQTLEGGDPEAAYRSFGTVEFLEADAQVHPFAAASYDVLISGFGVMFFSHPRAAFANLHRALRPSGRIAFVCWRGPLQVQWIALATAAVVPVLGRAPDLAEPGVPGPFAFADGDRLRGLLVASGFRNVEVEAVTRPQRIAEDVDDAVSYVLALPKGGQLLDGTPEGTRVKAAAALNDAFTPYAGPHGVVTTGAAWLVTAGRGEP